MNIKFARRVLDLKPSVTSEIREIARQEIQLGKKLINLAAGELQSHPPQRLLDCIKIALNGNTNLYTDAAGLGAFRSLIAEYHSKAEVNCKKSNVLISNGAKHALFNVLQVLVDPHDEVIVTSPCWQTYHNQIRLLGGLPVEVDSAAKDFQISIESILSALNEKTKAIILTLPGNPTGTLLSTQNTLKLQQQIKHKGIYLIIDIAYHRFCFDPDSFDLTAIIKSEPDNLILIDSLSKAFAITGWRIGYVLAEDEIINRIKSLQSHTSSNVNSLLQSAFCQLSSLSELDYFPKFHLQQILKNANYAYETLADCCGVTPIRPQGGFYVFCVIHPHKFHASWKIEDDISFCSYLMTDVSVSVTPGSAFGKYQGFRISVCNDEQELVEGIKKIYASVAQLQYEKPNNNIV